MNGAHCSLLGSLPLARSSSISRSFSFADMDRYKAVEYLFDWRAARPSFDETVFCREMGTWDDEDEVDALERCGMIATDILGLRVENDEGSHRFGTRPEFHAALVRRLDAMVLDCWVRADCINFNIGPLVVGLRWTLTSTGVECANFQSPGLRSAATTPARQKQLVR